jgi:hypothetical protein
VSLCCLLVEFQCVCLYEMADTRTLKRQIGQSLKRQERQIVMNVFNCIKKRKATPAGGWSPCNSLSVIICRHFNKEWQFWNEPILICFFNSECCNWI